MLRLMAMEAYHVDPSGRILVILSVLLMYTILKDNSRPFLCHTGRPVYSLHRALTLFKSFGNTH